MFSRKQDPPLSQHSSDDESLGLGFSDFAVDETDKDAAQENTTEKDQGLHAFAGCDTQLPDAAGLLEHHSTRKHSTIIKHAAGEPQDIGPVISEMYPSSRATPPGPGISDPTNPAAHTAQTNPMRPKPPRARSQQASTVRRDVTPLHHGLHDLEGRDQQAAATPPRQPVVIAPPPSAPRGTSGLFGHIRSLGDYILPGGAAWRSVTPPRATTGSMGSSGRRSSSADDGAHTSAGAAAGTGTDSGMRRTTSQQRGSAASIDNSVVHIAAVVGEPCRSAGTNPRSAPADPRQTSPALLPGRRTLCLTADDKQLPASLVPAYPSPLPPQQSSGSVRSGLTAHIKLPTEIPAHGSIGNAPMYHLRQEHLHPQRPTALQPPRRGPPDSTTNSMAADSLSGRCRAADTVAGNSMQARSATGGGMVSGRIENWELRQQATSAPESIAVNISSIAGCLGREGTPPERLGAPANDSSEAAASRGQVVTGAREKQQPQQRLRCDAASGGRRTPRPGGFGVEEADCSAGRISLEELHMAELEATAAVARVLSGTQIPQHAFMKKLRLLTGRGSRRRQLEVATGGQSFSQQQQQPASSDCNV